MLRLLSTWLVADTFFSVQNDANSKKGPTLDFLKIDRSLRPDGDHLMGQEPTAKSEFVMKKSKY
jgi:hypothetical protein